MSPLIFLVAGGAVFALLSSMKEKMLPTMPGTGLPGPVVPVSGQRAMVVSIAKSQLGHGPDDAYFISSMGSVPDPKPNWCGHFALWVLHSAGLGLDVTGGFRDSFDGLIQTTEPKPGDLAFYKSRHHVAVITGISGNQLETVNGNGTGGVVSLGHPTMTDVTSFYSIEPWITIT